MELHQSSLCKGPKGLNAVDMVFAPHKLIASVLYSIMLFVPQIHKTIITAPLIRVNNTVRGYFTPNNGLERGLSAIWDNLSVDFTAPLKDTKNRGFSAGSATTFALDAFATKIGFINFNFTVKG
jgi:hypothetical protein